MQRFSILLIVIFQTTFGCKYLQSIQILEINALHKSSPTPYIPSLPGIAQEVSVNLTKLFQNELSISTQEARQTIIFFTDATESRPFVIKQLKDGSRILTNELPVDREEICDPFKFPHHAAVSRKCCTKEERAGENKENPFNPQLDFQCCIFLGITVEGYGTFALRIDVVDVNDNAPRFNIPPEAALGHVGKDVPAVIKIVENTPQGTIIRLPQAFDLDEGKNSDLLFRVEKVNPVAAWEQHFKLLSGPEDRCITDPLTESQSRDITFPALCLLGTIDRETVPGFTFDLVARDQGDPMALSTTLSMSITVLDENDNAPTFKQKDSKVFVKENEVGKTLVHLHVTDPDAGENSRLSYFLRPGNHFVANQKPSADFLRMHILASPAPDGVVLRLIQPLDYEAVNSFDFEVVVQDYGTPRLASTATVSVEVLNMNDQPPVVRFFNKGNLLNSEYASLEREEDTDNQLPKVICHVHVYDQDTNLDEVFCDISSPQRLFDLREVSSENTIQRRKVYELISLALLDREKAPSYSVSVRCLDGRTATRLIGQSQIRIILKDANDNPPVFEKSQFFGTVVENEANAVVDFRDSFSNYGQLSAQFASPSHIRATDADAGPNAAIAYSLAPWNREEDANSTTSEKDDYEFFHIDRISGQLKTRVPLDYETKSSYYLLVIATDQPLNASQTLTSSAKLIITVKDLDDNPPTMLQQTYVFEVMEGMPSHTVVGRVEATDADSLPENRIVNYQLRALTGSPLNDDGPSSISSSSAPVSGGSVSAVPPNAALHFFTIDRHHGIIRTLRPLDREQTPKIVLEVVALSGSSGRFRTTGSTSPSSTSTVVITVLDKNDNAPYMVSLASPVRKRILLAEVVIPSDKLQGEPPICVPFPYAFNDDDDQTNGNGNVTVTLDKNPNFEFNDDQTSLCLKVDKKKGKSNASPGRYSLNILAQDNPKEMIHRLTKRFPLRVLIQSPFQESNSALGTQKHQEAISFYESSAGGDDSMGRQPGKSPAADRILSAIHRPTPVNHNRSLGNTNWEYRNVTIIAVLVCMACILCIILLAILLFMKKCTRVKNFAGKDHQSDAHPGGLAAPLPMNLHSLSPKVSGRYPSYDADHYPCMLVTLPPGSEKGFAISPTGQVVGSVIYADDASRMSPLLTQKNNLMMPVCHAGSLQKVAFGPLYGTSRVTDGLPPNVSVAKPPVCSIPLMAQYSTQAPVNISQSAKNPNYSDLLPSKSYDELLHCASTKISTLERQQQQRLLGAFKNAAENNQQQQDGYQLPLANTTTPSDRNPTSTNYNSAISFTPLQMSPTSSRPPSRSTDPCGCGQASFV
ncbi:hypothetical protein Aperf_G00000044755 [Anoplocephala perfoliata]